MLPVSPMVRLGRSLVDVCFLIRDLLPDAVTDDAIRCGLRRRWAGACEQYMWTLEGAS